MSTNLKVAVAPFIPAKEVVFPGIITSVFIGREKSIKSLEISLLSNNELVLFVQKDKNENYPEVPEGIHNVGVMVNIIQSTKLPDGIIRILVEAEKRVKLIKVIEKEDFYKAEYEEIKVEEKNDTQLEALKRKVLSNFETYLKLTNRISNELMMNLNNMKEPTKLFDLIASTLNVSAEKRCELLCTIDTEKRGYKLLNFINEELEILDIEKKIDTKVKDQMVNVQKNYYLKEKMRAIKEELGEEGTILNEIDELKVKVEESKLPASVKEKVAMEVSKLSKMPNYSSEFSVLRNYIDAVLELPWSKETKDVLDIKKAAEILEENHFALSDVKERILEFLAVKKLNKKMGGSILCLFGPPGVGKTSLGRSIAKAMGRKFARISLGGVKDEAEIKGHRRTYVGAMPGRIIKELKHVGTKNPVLLLDEIDKMATDFHGDPAAALLEVLDIEQNSEFVDNYVDMPFDLSKVLFIATANDMSKVLEPLRDRLEIIKISSYTEYEKLNIAKLYLINKSKEENGLTNIDVNISNEAMLKIINEYTREAGVRNLKREIDRIFRKVAKAVLEKHITSLKITVQNLSKYLGNPRFLPDNIKLQEGKVGVAIGVAWMATGGSTLEVQSVLVPGKGKLILTGTLGEVMQESVKVAFSFIKFRSKEFNIPEEKFRDYDIHIHFPEGATPKDGPSAGVAIVTSIISSLTGRKVRQNIAMTGEITMTGDVLPVGGIKEKVLGAHRAGIKEVIMPKHNKPDTDELPKEIKKDTKFHFIDSYDKVFDLVLFK